MNHSDFFFGTEPEAENPEPVDSVSDSSTDAAGTQAADTQVENGHSEDEQSEDGQTEDTMTEPDSSESKSTSVGDVAGLPWDEAVSKLQSQFPETSQGILFCVHKLLADREARLAEFRGEAEVRGIKLSGRSIHSAKVLLGYAEPVKRRTKKVKVAAAETVVETIAEAPKPRAKRSSKARPLAVASSPSEALAVAVEQIQSAAREEAEGLKDAIRQAIAVLQDALED